MQHKLFLFSMWWRIVYGIIRVVLGITLLKLIHVPLLDIFNKIMSYELIEDPTDIIFTTINSYLATNPLSITYFLAIYFIFWGVTDTVLSWSLLKDETWAFPISIMLIGIFIPYELYRFTHTHSILLLTFIFIDSVIFILIAQEYRRIKTKSSGIQTKTIS